MHAVPVGAAASNFICMDKRLVNSCGFVRRKRRIENVG